MRDQDGAAEDRSGEHPASRAGRRAQVIESGADAAQDSEQREDDVGGRRDAQQIAGQRAVEGGEDDDEEQLDRGAGGGRAAAEASPGEANRPCATASEPSHSARPAVRFLSPVGPVERLGRLAAAMLAGAATVLAFGVAGAAGAGGTGLEIEVLSNRADLISAGDALVAVGFPRGVRPAPGPGDR